MRQPGTYLYKYHLHTTKWIGRQFLPVDRHILWRRRATLRKLSKPAMARLEWMIWYEMRDKNALATARHYGVSAKTFWKWRKRFNELDLSSLEERSRVPVRRRERTITQQEEVRIV